MGQPLNSLGGFPSYIFFIGKIGIDLFVWSEMVDFLWLIYIKNSYGCRNSPINPTKISREMSLLLVAQVKVENRRPGAGDGFFERNHGIKSDLNFHVHALHNGNLRD